MDVFSVNYDVLKVKNTANKVSMILEMVTKDNFHVLHHNTLLLTT